MRDPRLVRFDTFTEVQDEITARLAVAEDCYRANKGTDDAAALVAFGRVQELRGLSAALAWKAAQG